MANSPVQREQSPPAETPLLDPSQNQTQSLPNQPPQCNGAGGETVDADLDRTMQRLEKFLAFLGFSQSSTLSLVLSWTAFVVIGVALPVTMLELSHCSGCERYQNKDFELAIVSSQACLAGVSLFCLSRNLRKHGMRKFLFVDQLSGRMGRLKDRYIKQITDSVKLLVIWSLPCFALKAAREIIRVVYVPHESWWQSVVILLSLMLSWTYLSTIFLAASSMFHLVCNLQVIHFEDYAKLMEGESDISLFIYEHIRLRHYLSKISHRFRIFLLLQFLVVTASQIVTLFQTTLYSRMITFIDGGDFAVSSVVQVIGMIISLHAATKISHRAQAIASFASKWHAMMSCAATDSNHMRASPSGANLEATNALNSLRLARSESDMESIEYATIPPSTHFPSTMSSYYKRQAFVLYLQMNPGGITIFGWTIDRALINTIFCIELTLVTFVLGKTIIS